MHKILIVDDEEINRSVLEAGLSDKFEVLQATNGKDALELLYFDETIEAILLDLNMPKMNGFEVLKDMNETSLIKKIPVYIVTSASDDDELLDAYELGAVDVVSKPYNIQFLRRRLENTIELFAQRNNLSHTVEEKTKELIRQNNRLVEAMADIVEFRSNESGTHVKRVSGYTKLLMKGLISEYKEYKYLYKDIDSISFAACLHDLGKITIPDQILNKPGKLTPEEFEIMKTHTIKGYEKILKLKDIMNQNLYEFSQDIVRHHHERYDGHGYPDRLEGDDIPIWSQAVSLADVYDALTTDRCYKKAFDHEVACEMILNGECGVFGPKITNVFKSLMNRFNQLRQEVSYKRILIVDDSEIDRSTLRNMLSDEFDITEIESGMLALEHLAKQVDDYDLIILDVLMPEMDGFDLLRRLGRNYVEKACVVMCSVDVDKESLVRAYEYGVKAFLKKPFDYDVVREKVEFVINRKGHSL